MTIVIDGRPFIKPLTGIGVFLQCFIKSLQKNENFKIYILLPAKLHPSVNINFKENVHVYFCPILGFSSIPRIIWFLFKVPFILYKLKPDLFISAYTAIPICKPSETKTLATVHDVVNIEYSETMSWINRFNSNLIFNYAIKKSDYLWSNSHYTKNKILEYYPKRKAKKIIVGLSVDSETYHKLDIPKDEEIKIKQKYTIKEKFILFVGSIEPRKNLEFLLSLMPSLANKNIQLLVVGGTGWKNSYIYNIVNNNPQIKASTIFAGYVTNEELAQLYNLANCYVSTSLNEGFGMPQLEAMFCGCHVICPHNSGMIEVVSGKGITIEGWEKDTWIKKILETIQKEKPQYNLTQYNWDVICENVMSYCRI